MGYTINRVFGGFTYELANSKNPDSEIHFALRSFKVLVSSGGGGGGKYPAYIGMVALKSAKYGLSFASATVN